MKRRRFLFWISLGVFSLGERLGIGGLDNLAAAMMPADEAAMPVHWQPASNPGWKWYERETYIRGRWTLTGITTPINKQTGQPYSEQKGYLDPSLVPAEFRVPDDDQGDDEAATPTAPPGAHLPSAARRARHGRPPSKWLRSLNADELRIWLRTIDVPDAYVEGMTYFEHLTRDHFFDGDKIEGLRKSERAKLHAAAHFGY